MSSRYHDADDDDGHGHDDGGDDGQVDDDGGDDPDNCDDDGEDNYCDNGGDHDGRRKGYKMTFAI